MMKSLVCLFVYLFTDLLVCLSSWVFENPWHKIIITKFTGDIIICSYEAFLASSFLLPRPKFKVSGKRTLAVGHLPN